MKQAKIINQLADYYVLRAGRDDAAASQAAGLRVEALLASWPFGSFGLSQKNGRERTSTLSIRANSEIEARFASFNFSV
ncbi:hypothetical protein LZF95_00085 [Algoriphagus sp. AGSA1]|uniref:hypothetical protein n=1 Tax=Algoriphagus sp. AGSA1 TaxID=2907213 RepID=UPI001F4016B5|nr:hypothetical protein [Algoriphagus sp. AGSA1]MCE7053052.1 hypothetical protein [Algoriphagus sp. AGSA1]